MIISETDPSSVHDGEMMSNCSNLMEYSPNNIINCPNYNKKAHITLKVAQNNVKMPKFH